MPEERQKFRSYQILTCNHALIHHHCGVTKENSAKNNEGTAYELVVKAKNIFNTKWSTPECDNPDIYGRNGSMQSNTPWAEEVPL